MTKPRMASERRLYPRIPVNLPGEIQVNGWNSVPCHIRDLCQDGLLFECTATDDNFVQGLNIQTFIRFALPLTNGQYPIQTWIQVLQRGDSLFGAKFLRLDSAELAKLGAYLKSTQAKDDSIKPVTADVVQTARTILRRVTIRCIEDLTKPILAAMQEALWMAYEQSLNDAERSGLADDIGRMDRAVRQRRFQEQLRRELMDNVLQQKSSANSNQPPQLSTNMTLVDQEGFEQWLAVAAVIERLERKLGDTLVPLRNISVGVFGNDTTLSIEPQGLTRSIWQTLATTGISTQGQLTCLRAIVKPLPGALETYYKTITENWTQAGLTQQILPKSVTNPIPQGSTSDNIIVKSPINQPIPQPTEHTAISSVAYSSISAEELSTLLLNESNTEILNSSPPIQSRGKAGVAVQTLADRITKILINGKSGNPGMLPPILDERVKVSGAMLTRMAEDQNVPQQARKLIQNLSMRVMSAAVIEPGFFTTDRHPLVDILDQFEHLAVFLPKAGTANTPTQRAVELLMQKALTTSPKNRTALRTLSQHLADLQQRLGGEWLQNAEQIMINCESKERVRMARHHVRTRLNETFAGCSMHATVAELARQAWRILLQLTWVREGGEKTKWQRYWQILLKLHHICSAGDPTLTEEEVTSLLKEIRDGLRLTGLDPYQRVLMDEQIEEALRQARFSKPDRQVVFSALPADADELQEQEPLPNSLLYDAGWNKALESVDELEMGANLQLHHKDCEQHWRLVWRSGNGKELVFVDPSTLQSKTLGRFALARLIQDKTAQISTPIAQPLTSRAVDATLQEMQQRIRYHETHDILTGLHNRRQLDGILTQIIANLRSNKTSRTSKPNQVLGFLDLDRFEAMTGIGGYTIGERLVTTVARLLQKQLKSAPPTCLAYLGGNRFAFLVPIKDAAAAEALGHNICVSIAATAFYWRAKAYPLSCSIGLVLITATGEQNSETLLSAADTTCLAAQRSGGGRALLFKEGDADIFQHQQRMHDWIQAEGVVKGKRLRLRGQRIAATGNPINSPHHYEVLLSVYDERGTMLPLDAFISAAEAFHLMADIDRLVLNKALEWVHTHPVQTRALGGIAINLSGQSLGDRRLIGIIGDSLRSMAIPPELISFEVTETTAIANLDQAAAIVHGIKAIGCHFALDDFGAGLSSYSYLKRLPVDYIKIDGSFIKDLLLNPNDQIIVKSINEVAHFMGKQTIAEYVENAEILTKLQEMGIDYVQGYAIGKPQFLDEVP